jgi:Fur family transcriptional regulator, zinc uptake regulator
MMTGYGSNTATTSCCHAHGVMAAEETLVAAEAYCRVHGLRLTPHRRAVLDVLARACAPLGAYDLIERMRQEGARAPAPIVIYRVLDFLKEHGFIHRLETLNAFIACPHRHNPAVRVVFLICETCKQVEEVVSSPLDSAISALARKHDFMADKQVMELAGTCRTCRKANSPQMMRA